MTNHEFEPEWQLDAPQRGEPREVPFFLKNRFLFQPLCLLAIALFIVGILFVGIRFLPGFQSSGGSETIHQVLKYVGAVAILAGAFLFIEQFISQDRKLQEYLEKGIPVVAKIIKVDVKFDVHSEGDPTPMQAFTAVVKHPANGDFFELNRTSEKEIDLKVNDIVTACYLPHQFEKSITLYPLIKQNVSDSIIAHHVNKHVNALKICIILATIIITSLACYSGISRVSMIETPSLSWPVKAAIFIFAGLPAYFLMIRQLSKEYELESDPGKKVLMQLFILLGIALIVNFMAPAAATTINACYDRGQPVVKPATITDCYMISGRRYSIYKLKFQFNGEDKEHEVNCSYDDYKKYRNSDITECKTALHVGLFGWKYVTFIK